MVSKCRWIVGFLTGIVLCYVPLSPATSVPVIDESIKMNGSSNPAVETQDLSDGEEEVNRVPISRSTRSNDVSPLSLEQRVTRLEKQMNARAEMVSQLEELHQEITELRGQLEVSTHQIQLLSQKQPIVAGAVSSEAAQTSSSNTADAAEIEAYQKAYDAIKAKDFDRARAGFQDYLRQYSKGVYAGNAHYWLGEIYLHQGALTRASAEFNQVIVNPKNAKYPDAMLKMGFVYAQQGAWTQARKQLDQVKQQFPDSTVATLANAKLQELTQQGH